MRIAIIGAGGIGGYFGTRLIERYKNQSHEVAFIQRGAHLQAIRRDGLRYLTKDHEYLARPILATDDCSQAGPIDLAIVCVKSYDLEGLLRAIAGNLSPQSIVLTTLNGVNIAERAGKVLDGPAMLPGCIYISAHVEKPGIVRQVGAAGPVFFGPQDGNTVAYAPLQDMFQGAGIKATLTADIRTKLWEKYLFVCPFATITTARGLTMGQVMADPQTRSELECLMREIQALAKAEGVDLADKAIEDCLKRAAIVLPETKTSMQVDAGAGKRLELDVFTEYVVEQGKKLGLSLPCHEEMYKKLTTYHAGGISS